MQTSKQEALNAISTLPDSVNFEDIMYRLFVLDKIRKGQDAVLNGELTSTDELRAEIESW